MNPKKPKPSKDKWEENGTETKQEPKGTGKVYFKDLYELKEERKIDEEEFYYVDHLTVPINQQNRILHQ